jgi:DNA-binding response OmpR family regulator
MNKDWLVAVGDDDQVVGWMVKTWLENAGHRAHVYCSPKEFLRGIRETPPDIALLDVVFGPADGFAICADLRKDPALRDLPIILISAHRRDIPDIVDGLQYGADDYLTKPLDRRLTLAKIESLLQRRLVPAGAEAKLDADGLQLDLRERRVLSGKREIPLTRREFDLLVHLLRNRHQVVTARQLMEEVWGYEPAACDDPATVQVHFSRLRRKLGKDFSARLQTLVNVGYRFD